MWLNRLERKFHRAGIPRLMLYVVVGTLMVFLFDYILIFQGGSTLSSLLYFNRNLVLQGQLWRIITFVLIPPQGSALLVAIGLYFYYFVGSSLESAWGSFRFTFYYLIGILGSLAAGFIAGATTAAYLNLSLFFAYAALFPERQVLLFFFIPIKVKWLGIIDGAFFAYSIAKCCIAQDWANALAAVMAVVNFLLFFGPGLISNLMQKAKYAKSRKEFRQKMNNSWSER